MRHVGIDVSKKTLEVTMLQPRWKAQYENTPAGRKKLVERLSGHETRVVMEATASYGEDIARALYAVDGIEVIVANPRRTKAFAKVLEQRGKTDTLDSELLARFGATVPSHAWAPASDAFGSLRSWMRRRLQLVEQRTAEKVRLAEMKSVGSSDPELIRDVQGHIEELDRRIKRIEKRVQKLVKSNAELQAWRKQLVTIPGVADITAFSLMSELGHLPADMDVRQVVAYAGLDPMPHQSGAMDSKRRISKRGNQRLRTTLFLAAWNVARYSPEVGQWRQGLLDRGKSKKAASIAVARKLIHAVEGMRRSQTNWDGSRFHGRQRRHV